LKQLRRDEMAAFVKQHTREKYHGEEYDRKIDTASNQQKDKLDFPVQHSL
jgi:hypothetical protein